MGLWTQKGSEVRIKDPRESKERHFNNKEGEARRHFLSKPELTMWEGQIKITGASDCWQSPRPSWRSTAVEYGGSLHQTAMAGKLFPLGLYPIEGNWLGDQLGLGLSGST